MMAVRCKNVVITLVVISAVFSILLYLNDKKYRRLQGVISGFKQTMERQRQEYKLLYQMSEPGITNSSNHDKHESDEIKSSNKKIPGRTKDENEANGKSNRTMTPEEISALFFNSMTNITYQCQEGRRMGHPLPLDGGWNICLDVGVKQNACIVYSFGIAGDWSFDDDMAEYGCDVYSFDPFNGLEKHKRSARIWFYDIGLLDKDDDHVAPKFPKDGNKPVKCRTLSSIKKMLHHEEKNIDVLKMDIDSDELKVVPQLLKDDVLGNIKQLDLEVHPGKGSLWISDMFKTLKQEFGFKLWFVNENKYSPLQDYGPNAGVHHRLLELAFVNTKFLSKK
ncbi:probable methyltransferase-like protein 24 [Ptychodera flava]|uniref:probable methyltransferase-like protein 24 n=1 Tax=Ptychodera flava TaxID=63121 RepID=UPI00396A057A